MSASQISAFISASTRARLERLVRARGVTKAHVIEQALLHHLQALDELPEDAILPARIVLDPAEANRLSALMDAPPAPTEAMKRLFDVG